MDRMIRLNCILLFIIGCYLSLSSACSCKGNTTISDRFCFHHVVARIKILELMPETNVSTTSTRTPIDRPHSFEQGSGSGSGDPSRFRTYRIRKNDRVYLFQFIKVYRNATNKNLNATVRTAGSSAMCGCTFVVGAEYLLFADVNGGGQLRTGLCYGNAVWSILSQENIAVLDHKQSINETCFKNDHDNGMRTSTSKAGDSNQQQSQSQTQPQPQPQPQPQSVASPQKRPLFSHLG